jgi:hypothetical protein
LLVAELAYITHEVQLDLLQGGDEVSKSSGGKND